MKELKNYLKETPHIRYSNCHEDSDFALNYIKGTPKKMLTIASALDNSLAFLLLEPQSVLAIDNNITQIYLCNLKKCGIKYLEYKEFLALLGIQGDSAESYNRIRGHLDEETRSYFDSHLFLITEIGVVNCGKFEYYFQVFKKYILSKTHSSKTIHSFMTADTLEKQNEIFKKRFNNLRLRFIFRLFFSKAFMKRLGRDKAFFEYTKGPLSAGLKQKFDRSIACNLNKDNPYLQYIILGEMKCLPTYLKEENFKIIKKNIDRLEIQKADFSEVLNNEQKYDFMYLSDIFEYISEEETALLSKKIYNSLNDGAQVLLYNMMNERHFCEQFKETELNQDKNRTFYYSHCYHYEKR